MIVSTPDIVRLLNVQAELLQHHQMTSEEKQTILQQRYFPLQEMQQQQPSAFVATTNGILKNSALPTDPSDPVHRHASVRQSRVSRPSHQVAETQQHPSAELSPILTSIAESPATPPPPPPAGRSSKRSKVVVEAPPAPIAPQELSGDDTGSGDDQEQPQQQNTSPSRGRASSAAQPPKPKKAPAVKRGRANIEPEEPEIVPLELDVTPWGQVKVKYAKNDIRNPELVQKLCSKSLSYYKYAPVDKVQYPNNPELADKLRLKAQSLKFSVQRRMDVDGDMIWTDVAYGSVGLGKTDTSFSFEQKGKVIQDYFVGKNFQDKPATRSVNGEMTVEEIRCPKPERFRFDVPEEGQQNGILGALGVNVANAQNGSQNNGQSKKSKTA